MDPALPDDQQLAEIAQALDDAGLVADIFDPDFRLVWLSREFRALIGEEDPEVLGYGKHIGVACQGEAWRNAFGEQTLREIARASARFWIGEADVHEIFEQTPELRSVVEGTEPEPLPAAWSIRFDLKSEDDTPPSPVSALGMKVRGPEGAVIALVEIFASGLPQQVQSMLVRGDERVFERMARLVEPGQRPAAVLFADLDSSSKLSRRLPTPTYFDLVRALTTRIDAKVIEHRGIPGKHAGDGTTAFFLAEDLGSPSAAVRAAIEAARALRKAASEAASQISTGDGALSPEDCTFNVGLHWGPTLYIGQIVTGGRLEVTALGDEVNEAARIEETATGGRILASKPLIEQLSAEDAAALGIDTSDLTYTQIYEVEDAPDKAVRDAGTLPVAPV